MSNSKSPASFCLTLAVPLLYFLNLYLIWSFPRTISLHPAVLMVGTMIAFIGVVLWAVSFWQLKSVFQVLPTANKRLKRGIYRWLKHPMYTGIFLTFTGLGLAFQSKEGLMFTLLLILPLLTARALLEEKKLID